MRQRYELPDGSVAEVKSFNGNGVAITRLVDGVICWAQTFTVDGASMQDRVDVVVAAMIDDPETFYGSHRFDLD